MSKLVKDLIARNLQTRFAGVDNAIWLELVGVDGVTTNEFRRDLHSRDMRLEVVKNSLLRRAVGDGPLSKLAAALSGPAALVTGGESIIDAAKVIDAWRPKIKSLKVQILICTSV